MKNKTKPSKHYIWNATLSPKGLVSISKGPKKRYRQILDKQDRIVLRIRVKGRMDELFSEFNRIAKHSEALALVLFQGAFLDFDWELATGSKSDDEVLRQIILQETGF